LREVGIDNLRQPSLEDPRYGSAALNEPPTDPRLRQHMQTQQQYQQAHYGNIPVPPPLSLSRTASNNASAGYRPGSNYPGYAVGEGRERVGSDASIYSEGQRLTQVSTPTHAQLQQQQQMGGSLFRAPTPSSTPTHAQYAAARAAQSIGPFGPGAMTPLSQQRYASQSGYPPNGAASTGIPGPLPVPPAEDMGVSGLAARAMDSLNLNSAYNDAPAGDGYSADQTRASYSLPSQVQVRQQQGYATATRYGEVVPAAPSQYPQAPAQRYATPPYGQQPAYQQQQPPHQQQVAHGPHYGAGASAMPSAPPDLIYQVQFKRGVRSFTLSPRANFTVRERDFVVVEADRGEDIGIVVEVLPMHAFMERRMNMPRPSAQQQQDGEDQNVCCILRLATLHERQQLPDKFHTEKDIVQVRAIIAPVLRSHSVF
jgi:hypothetical protein